MDFGCRLGPDDWSEKFQTFFGLDTVSQLVFSEPPEKKTKNLYIWASCHFWSRHYQLGTYRPGLYPREKQKKTAKEEGGESSTEGKVAILNHSIR